jgi:hypothetical protein
VKVEGMGQCLTPPNKFMFLPSHSSKCSSMVCAPSKQKKERMGTRVGGVVLFLFPSVDCFPPLDCELFVNRPTLSPFILKQCSLTSSFHVFVCVCVCSVCMCVGVSFAGRAGVPMEVMGLLIGEFIDDYTVRVVDVFSMPQSGTGVSVEAVDPVFQTKMLDMLKQTWRFVPNL